MLVGKDLGWRHDTCLISVIDGQQATHEGYKGLTGTYVALQQSVHLMPGLKVVVYLVNDPFLCVGKVKGQGLVQSMETCSDNWHGETGILFPAFHLPEDLQLDVE